MNFNNILIIEWKGNVFGEVSGETLLTLIEIPL